MLASGWGKETHQKGERATHQQCTRSVSDLWVKPKKSCSGMFWSQPARTMEMVRCRYCSGLDILGRLTGPFGGQEESVVHCACLLLPYIPEIELTQRDKTGLATHEFLWPRLPIIEATKGIYQRFVGSSSACCSWLEPEDYKRNRVWCGQLLPRESHVICKLMNWWCHTILFGSFWGEWTMQIYAACRCLSEICTSRILMLLFRDSSCAHCNQPCNHAFGK